MAQLAHRSGLGEDVIEAIENGRRRRGVTVDELTLLARALDLRVSNLLPADPVYLTNPAKRELRQRLLAEKANYQNEFNRITDELAKVAKHMRRVEAEIAQLELPPFVQPFPDDDRSS